MRGAALCHTPRRVCCRVQALKALCEIRLEKDDIVFLIEDAIKPCKATRQAAKQTGFWPSLDDFRREPMGEDSSGLAYYWFDLHLSPEGEPCGTAGLRDAAVIDTDASLSAQLARAHGREAATSRTTDLTCTSAPKVSFMSLSACVMLKALPETHVPGSSWREPPSVCAGKGRL